jgi:antitoxin PrlF
MKSRISSKGQVTVPVEIREQLGLTAGTEIDFVLRDGEVVLRKGGGPTHPVDRIYGRLRLAQPVDVLLDAMRGPRPRARPNRRRRARA